MSGQAPELRLCLRFFAALTEKIIPKFILNLFLSKHLIEWIKLMKYGLSEKGVRNETWTWIELLEGKSKEANSVEFNQLYKSSIWSQEIESLTPLFELKV